MMQRHKVLIPKDFLTSWACKGRWKLIALRGAYPLQTGHETWMITYDTIISQISIIFLHRLAPEAWAIKYSVL